MAASVQPFYPPNQIVRDAAGRTYMANEQGQLVPVQIQQAPSAGSPSQPQVPNAMPTWNQPQPVAQPQQQWGQPQPQAQMPQTPAGMTDATIMQGPGVPQELQGRTWAQVKQLWLAARQQLAGQQPNGQPNGQPPVVQPQQAPNGQPAQPMDARTFYMNPEANTRRIVEETVRSAMEPMLRPLMQNSAHSAAEAARTQFLQANPAAAAYMLQMQPMIERAGLEALSDARTWDAIYNYTLGESLRRTGYNPNPQGQPQAQQPQAPQWGQPAAQPQPQQWNSPAPVRSSPNGDFFSESSTPSQGFQTTAPVAANLTPWQAAIARGAGQSAQEYAQAAAALTRGEFPTFGLPAGGQNGR